jgi:hypothetical protein
MTCTLLAADDGQDPDPLRAVYRDRAHLLGVLALTMPARLTTDPAGEPGSTTVLFLRTPAGQVSFHIADVDLDVLEHVRWAPAGDQLAVWDGHDKDTALARPRQSTQLLLHDPWANPTC